MSDQLNTTSTETGIWISIRSRLRRRASTTRINIRTHSNLIHWWPVWLWSAICAIMTHFYHVSFTFPAPVNKVINFFPMPWLGLSFLAVFLFVLFFSNNKLPGLEGLFVVLGIVILFVILSRLGVVTLLGKRLEPLDVLPNEAFYWSFSFVIFLPWTIGVVFIPLFHYYQASPSVLREVRFGHFQPPMVNFTVTKMPHDFFRHTVGGLFGLIDICDLVIHTEDS